MTNLEIIDAIKTGQWWADETPTKLTDFLADYSKPLEFIAKTKADIRYEGDLALYFYEKDYIVVPPRKQFADQAEFFVIVFHELSHWAEKRIGWFGTIPQRELVAEIVAVQLARQFNLPVRNQENYNFYLTEWNELINSPEWLAEVANMAQKIIDYLNKE